MVQLCSVRSTTKRRKLWRDHRWIVGRLDVALVAALPDLFDQISHTGTLGPQVELLDGSFQNPFFVLIENSRFCRTTSLG